MPRYRDTQLQVTENLCDLWNLGPNIYRWYINICLSVCFNMFKIEGKFYFFFTFQGLRIPEYGCIREVDMKKRSHFSQACVSMVGRWIFNFHRLTSLYILYPLCIMSLCGPALIPSKQDTLTQCCIIVGPATNTVGQQITIIQHWVNLSCLL